MEHVDLKETYRDSMSTRYNAVHRENGHTLAYIVHTHCEQTGKDEAVVQHYDRMGREHVRSFDKDRGGYFHMGDTPLDAAKSFVYGYLWELERGEPLRRRK